MTTSRQASGFYRRYGKRALDLGVALPAGVILLPVVAIVAAAVYWNFGRPVFFRQTRPGYKERPFTIVKFRTMNDARNAEGQLLSDAERLTRFGKFLRASSLDELPELWNIIKGEMSLVGPRPLLMQYLPLYSPEQRRRHEMPPGLTGLAQVSGRNAITWEDRLSADVRYVDTCSLRLDLAVLLRTVLKIAMRDGITAPGEATMPVFRGSEPARPNDSEKAS